MTAVHFPPSTAFHYRNGILHCDDVPLTDLADEGGPTWVYSARVVDQAYAAVDQAMSFAPHLIAYAVKANGNLAILARLAKAGAGADIVSEGELRRALRAGVPADRIVWGGVGKRDRELRVAAGAGLRAIHIECIEELDLLERFGSPDAPVRVALRINPDVDSGSHPYLSTGLHSTKFGLEVAVARSLLPRLVQSRTLRLEGVACHVGSQLDSPVPLREATRLLALFARECLDAGAPLRSIDPGGGWPMSYGAEETPFPPHQAFGAAIAAGIADAGMSDAGLEVVTEPGRALVGDAGILLVRVLAEKHQGGRRFVIVDGAMTELVRPALYGAHHAVMPVREHLGEWSAADVVGPVCESGDFLARGRPLPAVKRGDLLAIRGAGAYGREMSSTYNGRPAAREILVDGKKTRMVRRRGTISSLWALEEP